jgi:hypothetical protein
MFEIEFIDGGSEVIRAEYIKAEGGLYIFYREFLSSTRPIGAAPINRVKIIRTVKDASTAS